MGIVLSFTPRPAAINKPSIKTSAAAVVIFPGVRYEREEAAGQGRPPSIAAAPRPAPATRQ